MKRLLITLVAVGVAFSVPVGYSVAEEAEVKTETTKKKADFKYSGQGRRDPFKPLLKQRRPVGPARTTPLEPLERFTLGQLKVKAVLLGFKVPRAMVQAPDGKSYIVVPGSKIGKNRGIVQGINPEAVVVKETYYDFSGDIRTSVKQIKLPKRKGI